VLGNVNQFLRLLDLSGFPQGGLQFIEKPQLLLFPLTEGLTAAGEEPSLEPIDLLVEYIHAFAQFIPCV
jgi:hypothetical protein